MKINYIACFIISFLTYSQKNIDINELYPKKDIIVKYHNYWTSKYYPERILEFKKNPLIKGGIVFLGNSITEGGDDWAKRIKIKNTFNRGISGDTTDGVLKRLEEIIFYKPKIVFILIGHNDLWSYRIKSGVPSIKYIGKNILKIVDIIKNESPNSSIYVQSILPTRHLTKDNYFEKSIIKINKYLLKNEKKFNYKFIDLYSNFIDANGLLSVDYTYDGGHLNEKGYELWSNIIKDIITTLPDF